MQESSASELLTVLHNNLGDQLTIESICETIKSIFDNDSTNEIDSRTTSESIRSWLELNENVPGISWILNNPENWPRLACDSKRLTKELLDSHLVNSRFNSAYQVSEAAGMLVLDSILSMILSSPETANLVLLHAPAVVKNILMHDNPTIRNRGFVTIFTNEQLLKSQYGIDRGSNRGIRRYFLTFLERRDGIITKPLVSLTTVQFRKLCEVSFIFNIFFNGSMPAGISIHIQWGVFLAQDSLSNEVITRGIENYGSLLGVKVEMNQYILTHNEAPTLAQAIKIYYFMKEVKDYTDDEVVDWMLAYCDSMMHRMVVKELKCLIPVLNNVLTHCHDIERQGFCYRLLNLLQDQFIQSKDYYKKNSYTQFKQDYHCFLTTSAEYYILNREYDLALETLNSSEFPLEKTKVRLEDKQLEHYSKSWSLTVEDHAKYSENVTTALLKPIYLREVKLILEMSECDQLEALSVSSPTAFALLFKKLPSLEQAKIMLGTDMYLGDICFELAMQSFAKQLPEEARFWLEKIPESNPKYPTAHSIASHLIVSSQAPQLEPLNKLSFDTKMQIRRSLFDNYLPLLNNYLPTWKTKKEDASQPLCTAFLTEFREHYQAYKKDLMDKSRFFQPAIAIPARSRNDNQAALDKFVVSLS